MPRRSRTVDLLSPSPSREQTRYCLSSEGLLYLHDTSFIPYPVFPPIFYPNPPLFPSVLSPLSLFLFFFFTRFCGLLKFFSFLLMTRLGKRVSVCQASIRAE